MDYKLQVCISKFHTLINYYMFDKNILIKDMVSDNPDMERQIMMTQKNKINIQC